MNLATLVLKNKPLIEAIFELRWKLVEREGGNKADPHFKLLVGRMFERLKGNYPFVEELPTSGIPEEISAYVIQHRLRKCENGWPVIQLGPGILSVNETDGYEWGQFEERITEAVDALYGLYPESSSRLKAESLALRYLDGVAFDSTNDNILRFLGDKLKTEIALHSRFFQETDVAPVPSGIDLLFQHTCKKPKGTIHVRFVSGRNKDAPALVIETVVQSGRDDVAGMGRDGICSWIQEAHEVTHACFFGLIAGDLQKEFE
jgi:uncharacterized protein (TIGR04255 family)